jgi:branched-subunit amino acid aminotransferase/4-amino-4-deoxychorismate lyase
MANFLFKKSFQLKTFKPIIYDDLWGKRGVFSTIRIIGNKPNYILFHNHLKNINQSLKKLNINFILSEKKLLSIIPLLNKIKRYDHLLRVALNSKSISISLRKRLEPVKNFQSFLYRYQRSNPSLKNLYYKKIIKKLSSVNTQKQEIILIKDNFLLEGCTTNILCVRNKTIYIPKNNFYKGTTMNYLLSKTKRASKKINISIHELSIFDEIILVGSGKGVINLKLINKINWKPKSNLIYKELLNIYNKLL